jgi:hypothetical protein
MKYRNRERLSGFADNKKKKINPDRPILKNTCDSKHTYFFWPYYIQFVTHI